MHRRKVNLACAVFLFTGALAASTGAQSNAGPYRVAPVAISSGGGTLSGGAFLLSGTFGQAQASTSAGSGYHLFTGFWSPVSDVVFANDFEK